MTVPANLNRVDYTGTGSAGPFTVPFPFYDASHLTVLQTDALFNQTTLTGWTATGAGGPSGAVTLAAACPVGSTLTIMRVVPLTQITSIKNQEAFYPEVHEQEMDLLAMADQQLDEAMDRTLRLPAGLSGVDMTLPKPDPGHALVWNAAGDGLENAGVASATLQQDLADSTDVAKGDEMIAVKQPFTGAVSRTQHDKNQEWASVKDFGAVGDGVTDDTQSIVKALSDIPSGKKLAFPYGIYKITGNTTIECYKDIEIEFEHGAYIDATACTHAKVDPIFRFGNYKYDGALGTFYALPGSVTKGVKAIDLHATLAASLAEGDMVYITSDTTYGGDGTLWNDSVYYFWKGELCEVLNVSGTTVTMKMPICDDYTTGQVACKIAMNKVTLRNFNMKCNGEHQALHIEAGKNVEIIGGEIKGAFVTCASVRWCYGAKIDGFKASNSLSMPLDNDYGLLIASSQNVVVQNCDIHGGRNAVDLGGWEPCRFVTITNNNLGCDHRSANPGAVGTHSNAEYVTISQNHIIGGLNISNKNVSVLNNEIMTPADYTEKYSIFMRLDGIRTGGVVPSDYIIVEGNTINNRCSTTGYPTIYMYFIDDGYQMDSVIVRNNTIENQNGPSISIISAALNVVIDTLEISGNHIRGPQSYGIGILADATNVITINKILIHHNDILSNNYGFYANFITATHMRIEGNILHCLENDSASVTTTNSTIDYIKFNNNLTRHTNVYYYPVRLVASTFIEFCGNTLSKHNSDKGINLTAANILIKDNTCVSCSGVASLTGRHYHVIYTGDERVITSGTSAPANGTWKVGDRCINTVPYVGQPKAWACTGAGTPGTWVSEGNL